MSCGILRMSGVNLLLCTLCVTYAGKDALFISLDALYDRKAALIRCKVLLICAKVPPFSRICRQ